MDEQAKEIHPVIRAHWEAWRDSDDRPGPVVARDAYEAGWRAALVWSKTDGD